MSLWKCLLVGPLWVSSNIPYLSCSKTHHQSTSWTPNLYNSLLLSVQGVSFIAKIFYFSQTDLRMFFPYVKSAQSLQNLQGKPWLITNVHQIDHHWYLSLLLQGRVRIGYLAQHVFSWIELLFKIWVLETIVAINISSLDV